MCALTRSSSIVMPVVPGAEVRIFARVLREVFDDAPWSEVEVCAHRAWKQIAQITGQDWEEVRDMLRESWLRERCPDQPARRFRE